MNEEDIKNLGITQTNLFTLLHNSVPDCLPVSTASKDLMLISFEINGWDIIFKYYQGDRKTVKTLKYNYFKDFCKYNI